jgi:hypothetical protein
MCIYDTISDVCFNCRIPLREYCITCQANQEKIEAQYCKKVIGKYNYCFHSHCIVVLKSELRSKTIVQRMFQNGFQ